VTSVSVPGHARGGGFDGRWEGRIPGCAARPAPCGHGRSASGGGGRPSGAAAARIWRGCSAFGAIDRAFGSFFRPSSTAGPAPGAVARRAL